MRPAPLLAAVALLGARCVVDCSGSRFTSTPCGLRVAWLDTQDQDALCRIASACPSGSRGARVLVSDSLAADCRIFGTQIAGCFDPDFDLIVIAPGPLDASALDHEFRHRALWLTGADLDYGHEGAIWRGGECPAE